MTSPIDLRDAVVAELKVLMPTVARNIEGHDGRIDADAIKSWIRTTPAIRVAVLGARRIVPVGNGKVDISWIVGVYAVEKDAAAAAGLTTAVIINAEGNQRALENVFTPQDMRCDNLHASTLERSGVTIWAATWTQTIRTGVDALAETGVVPTNAFASRSPEIGEAYRSDYRDVQTGEAPPDE